MTEDNSSQKRTNRRQPYLHSKEEFAVNYFLVRFFCGRKDTSNRDSNNSNLSSGHTDNSYYYSSSGGSGDCLSDLVAYLIAALIIFVATCALDLFSYIQVGDGGAETTTTDASETKATRYIYELRFPHFFPKTRSYLLHYFVGFPEQITRRFLNNIFHQKDCCYRIWLFLFLPFLLGMLVWVYLCLLVSIPILALYDICLVLHDVVRCFKATDNGTSPEFYYTSNIGGALDLFKDLFLTMLCCKKPETQRNLHAVLRPVEDSSLFWLYRMCLETEHSRASSNKCSAGSWNLFPSRRKRSVASADTVVEEASLDEFEVTIP